MPSWQTDDVCRCLVPCNLFSCLILANFYTNVLYLNTVQHKFLVFPVKAHLKLFLPLTWKSLCHLNVYLDRVVIKKVWAWVWVWCLLNAPIIVNAFQPHFLSKIALHTGTLFAYIRIDMTKKKKWHFVSFTRTFRIFRNSSQTYTQKDKESEFLINCYN